MRIPSINTLLKQHFFAGLLVVIPLAVCGWILSAVLGALWSLQQLVPYDWRPQTFVGDAMVVAIATALLVVGISILGWTSKQYLGRKALSLLGAAIERIPVLRSIYSSLDQLLRTLANGGGKQFNRVVYVEYPRKGMWTLAFVTGPAKHLTGAGAGEKFLNLFVPTTPNPTSGFYLIADEREVRDSHMAVEDAFRTLLSLGIAEPAEHNDSGAGK